MDFVDMKSYACYSPYDNLTRGNAELGKGLKEIYFKFFNAGKVFPQQLDLVSRFITSDGDVKTYIYLVDFFTGQFVHQEL